jgi:four helix bundle protein
MKISKLEDLIVWQEARILMKMVYKVTASFPSEEKYNLTKHMRGCVRNIPGNIAEGFGRFHYQESMQFYRIARGSLLELKSDMYCSFDCSYITQLQLDNLLVQNEKVGKLLNGFVKSTIKVKSKSDK